MNRQEEQIKLIRVNVEGFICTRGCGLCYNKHRLMWDRSFELITDVGRTWSLEPEFGVRRL